ncbi:MAG: maleylacetate reductase [Actinomycetota bacterium]|nr:maleylacetate reductase [Actinomycetota bacterium]
MRAFTYDALPGRVVFGVGSVMALPDEVERLGASRVLIVTDPMTKPVADELAEHLGERFAGVFSDVQQHVPIEAVHQANEVATRNGADCVVTVGGGSTTGFGKVIALETGVPTIAIPTTYAGSEMTPIYGITSDGLKRTGRDLRVLPKTVVYDPALTATLPPSVTGPSGMNALAHCVEALYAKDANPITSLMAEEGIRALVRGIGGSVQVPGDLDARSEALYGAYLAGAALGVVGMALHHRICHVLGGTYALAHGEVNSVILPHAARFNQPAVPDALDRAARALGAEDAAEGLFDFSVSIDAPTSLAALGMREADLEEAARLASEPPPWNPRPVTTEDVLSLLRDAFEGRRPAREARVATGS